MQNRTLYCIRMQIRVRQFLVLKQQIKLFLSDFGVFEFQPYYFLVIRLLLKENGNSSDTVSSTSAFGDDTSPLKSLFPPPSNLFSVEPPLHESNGYSCNVILHSASYLRLNTLSGINDNLSLSSAALTASSSFTRAD